MDTRCYEYMIAIAETGSIAAAAEKLYLTQSALNQQLLKLEKELGAPLFYRVRSRWTLTDVGKLFMDSAREIVRIQKETRNRITDLAADWKRMVSIGLTAERGMQMFSAIYSSLHAEFPDTIFQPVEENVEQQNQLLLNGHLDIAFQTVGDELDSRLVYQTITREPFLICVPGSHPLAGREQETAGGEDPVLPLTALEGEWLTLVKKTSTMRPMVDRMFEKAGFRPRLLFDSVGMKTMQKLAANGQCCCIIPRFYAVPDDRVVYFRPDTPASWQVAAVYARNHYLTRPARRFIARASAYWQTHLYIES